MNALEGAGKAVSSVADAMKGAPIVLALVIINGAFIGLVIYLLMVIGDNARERNATQIDLIKQMMRDCAAGDKPKPSIMFRSSRSREAPHGGNNAKPDGAKDDNKN